MIMQTAFFVISDMIPKEEAIRSIKEQIRKTYMKKGEEVVEMNYASVDAARRISSRWPSRTGDGQAHARRGRPGSPAFVKDVLAPMIAMKGDDLPVSVMPVDGTWPTGTTQYEKRSIAVHIPVWEPEICIQCGLCSFVCPHATIRIKA